MKGTGRYYIYASAPQDEELVREVVEDEAEARELVAELEGKKMHIEDVLYIDEASEQHQVQGWTLWG